MFDQASSLRKRVESKKRNTRIIAIASGKGGVGKSNLSVNLGLALQEQGEKILILDADLGMANVDILLGITPSYNLNHVLKGRCSLDEAVTKGPGGINILAGSSGIEEFVDINPLEITRLLDASTQLEKDYDLVLLDIGAGIHRSVINFIMACDEVIIVLTPEPTSIMDAYGLIKIIAGYRYKGANNIGLLFNQITSHKEGNEVAERMKKVIRDFLNLEVKILGFIPYDNYVRRAVQEQVPLLIKYPESNAVGAIKEIASGMLNRVRERDSRGMKGFIFRLIGIITRNNGGEIND